MVGRWFSFQDGLFSGAMLVSGRVVCRRGTCTCSICTYLAWFFIRLAGPDTSQNHIQARKPHGEVCQLLGLCRSSFPQFCGAVEYDFCHWNPLYAFAVGYSINISGSRPILYVGCKWAQAEDYIDVYAYTVNIYERPPKPPTIRNSYTRTLILDMIMKLSGTIGVTQKTMTFDIHVCLILNLKTFIQQVNIGMKSSLQEHPEAVCQK